MVQATYIGDNISEMQQTLNQIEVSEENLISIGEVRSAYASSISAPPIDDEQKADEIMTASLHTPLAQPCSLNGEALPTHKGVKLMLSDISIDALSLDHEIINTANKYTTLMSSMTTRLLAARERLMRNRQRIEDINFICSAYAGMKDVQPLARVDFSGKCTYSNGAYAAAATYMNEVKYGLDDITGNGYIGNAYVLDEDGVYLQKSNDTGKLENITDNSPSTVFEYSRLINDDNGVYTPNVQNKEHKTIVNFDDKDAECVIAIHSEGNDSFNTIVFSEPGNGLRVTQIETSNDGVTYKSHLGESIVLNGDVYKEKEYVPGCNLVMFPATSYAKIHLASDAVANDYALGQDTLSTAGRPTTVIKRLPNAKRKVISFGGIKAYQSIYQSSAIVTGNLAPSQGCKKIAIFANEYVPAGMTGAKASVKYELIVNGETYEVQPINSDSASTKVIASADSTYKNTGTLFIDDDIKTAQLKITFTASNEVSAFVGNIKACIG